LPALTVKPALSSAALISLIFLGIFYILALMTNLLIVPFPLSSLLLSPNPSYPHNRIYLY
jgi:hypothetical protein